MESAVVTFEVTDGVGLIRLNDPALRNAPSPELSNALARAVEAVLGENAGAIVLTAAYAGFAALSTAPVPTIAAVATPAIGVGVNLPLACDVILTAPSARFDTRWLDAGIQPGDGHLCAACTPDRRAGCGRPRPLWRRS
jgi:enoyl-CoA hydratase